MFFKGFSILSYLIRPHATSSTGYTKPYSKPNQSNLLSKLYADHNTLWVKQAAHQIVESLRAALFQSQTTHSTTTLSSIQSALNFLQNGRCSFIFRALFVQTTRPSFSPEKVLSSTSASFCLPTPPLLVQKFILTIPTNTSFLYTSPIFDFPVFAYYHPNNLYQQCFLLS